MPNLGRRELEALARGKLIIAELQKEYDALEKELDGLLKADERPTGFSATMLSLMDTLRSAGSKLKAATDGQGRRESEANEFEARLEAWASMRRSQDDIGVLLNRTLRLAGKLASMEVYLYNAS